MITCMHAASVCPTLIPPTNGNVIQNGNEFGDTAVYTCEPGFRLSGTRIRTCLDGGQWSGTASTCDGRYLMILYNPPPPPPPKHTHTHAHAHTHTYTCTKT